MKEWYTIPGDAGEQNHVRTVPYGHRAGRNIHEIKKVWVWPHCRQQGIGGRLMRWVTYEADHQGVELVLSVSGFGNPDYRMTDSQLLRWYARHGFECVADWRMRREPKLWLYDPTVLEAHPQKSVEPYYKPYRFALDFG